MTNQGTEAASALERIATEVLEFHGHDEDVAEDIAADIAQAFREALSPELLRDLGLERDVEYPLWMIPPQEEGN